MSSSLDDMTDQEIEEYLKKRRSARTRKVREYELTEDEFKRTFGLFFDEDDEESEEENENETGESEKQTEQSKKRRGYFD